MFVTMLVWQSDQLLQQHAYEHIEKHLAGHLPAATKLFTPKHQGNKKRVRLKRGSLVSEIMSRTRVRREALCEYGADFDVGASDGIGRKTKALCV